MNLRAETTTLSNNDFQLFLYITTTLSNNDFQLFLYIVKAVLNFTL